MSREDVEVLFDILIAEMSRDMNALRDDEISKSEANWMLMELQSQYIKLGKVYLQGGDPDEGLLKVSQSQLTRYP